MKKNLLVFCFILFGAVAANAQFTVNWERGVGSTNYAWFLADNNNTGLAYNPVTDRLYCSRRNDRIVILSPTNGDSLGILNTTGVGAESFKYNKIRVTADGAIYAISLATGAGTAVIYKWANEAATPTVVCNLAVSERAGDTFGASGTGGSTILYVSGSNSTKLYILTANGGATAFINPNTATLSAANVAGRGNIAAVTQGSANSDVWVDGPLLVARRLTISGNTATEAFLTTDGNGAGQFSAAYLNVAYLAAGSKRYLIGNCANNATNGIITKVINVTDEANVIDYSSYTHTVPGTWTTNTNGTGDLAIKVNANGSHTIFSMNTNNSIAAFSTGINALPVSFGAFTANNNGANVVLNWNTLSEVNNAGFDIQRSIDGVNFSKIGAVAAKGIAADYTFTDAKSISGTTYYRLKQLDKDGTTSLSGVVSVKSGASNSFVIKAIANPVSENLVLNIKSNISRNTQITITDVNGRVVLTKTQNIAVGENNISFNVSSLQKGNYFVKVFNEKGDIQQSALTIVKQ